MREHQIVINLKRDQFEEVQRLARLAGSKSVSAYLKERVLELLNPDAEADKQGGPTLEEMLNIDHELSRMHRELQVFIAESLSNSIYSGDDELQNEFDPDDFDQTFAAFQEMEKNMEEEIERMSSTPTTKSGGISRSQQSDTISNAAVDQRALHGPQAFKRAESQRASTTHRNQTPGSRRSLPVTPRDQTDADADQDYPITGFPLASENVLDASAEIPGMEEVEPIVLPPTPGANRARSSQRIRIIPTTPPPTPEEQAAHWKAQQPPVPAQTESGKSDASSDSGNTAEKTTEPESKTKPSSAPINTGVPDALPPSDWSGHPVSNFVESAGIYSNASAESIWFTPPTQVLKPGLQPSEPSEPREAESSAVANEQLTGSGSGTVSGDNSNPPPLASDTTDSGTLQSIEQPHSTFEQPNDELEDLADRAFAISPRLGTFDSSPNTPAGIRKRQVADPLDELIDGSIMEEAQRLRASNQLSSSPYDDGVVYAFGGPDDSKNAGREFPSSSHASQPQALTPESDDQRALLLGASDSGSETEPVYDATTRADAQPTSDSTLSPEAQTVSNPNIAFETQATSGSFPSAGATEDEVQQPSDIETAGSGYSQASENPVPPSAPSPDPSVLGGPPPKRKRTLDDSTSGDDDEIISGGPPPKRRKK